MNWIKFVNFFSPARSEIAENGADKVLSSEEKNSSVHKAYVNFPTSRKSALDVPLYAISSGRSMVEMLGVLAIIGVLSVGVMSGYSKAMMKYKLNKQAEALNLLINNALINLKEFGFKQNSTTEHHETLYKLGLIPDGITYQNKRLYDNFGTQIRVYTQSTQGSTYNYGIALYRLDTYAQTEVCRNIAIIAKENHANLKFLTSYDNETHDHYGTIYGDNYCTSKVKCLKNLTLNDIDKLCGEHTDIFYITWD